MRRNLLIWVTVAMSGFMVAASIYLLDSEYWGWATLFLMYGMFYICMFLRANGEKFLAHFIGKEDLSDAWDLCDEGSDDRGEREVLRVEHHPDRKEEPVRGNGTWLKLNR